MDAVQRCEQVPLRTRRVQRWQGRRRHVLSNSPLSQGWALAYFAGFALVMLAIAIGVARKRDA
jgi:hypothetical protein